MTHHTDMALKKKNALVVNIEVQFSTRKQHFFFCICRTSPKLWTGMTFLQLKY